MDIKDKLVTIGINVTKDEIPKYTFLADFIGDKLDAGGGGGSCTNRRVF